MTPVVVAGALANKPHSGGEAWVRLSWVRGLQQLGLDVRFVEQVEGATCTDGEGRPCAAEESQQVGWFRQVTERFGLSGVATLLVDGESITGPALDDLLALAPSAALVNISGHLADTRLFPAFRTRAMVDIDPGFTQIWHAMGLPGARVEGHDLHFTIAENIGTPGCTIPTSGIDWRPVRQPVVLEDWPVVPVDTGRPLRFTTVSSWRTPFGAVEHAGRTYPLKHQVFRRFMDLPMRLPDLELELALDIHPAEEADLAALRESGWRLVDPRQVAGDPDAFRAYLQGSAAELAVAQGVYAETNSGWFSDRSVRYLASGRPVLVQDTGVGRTLPTGEGLVTFRTPEEAAAGAERITGDHASHAEAARAIAEAYFAAEPVLTRFCDDVEIGTDL